MEEGEFTVGAADVAVPAGPPMPIAARTRAVPRWLAILEVIAVSTLPTQALVATVVMFGTNMAPFEDGQLSLEFLATVMLFDTALIALLIRVFLELSGEDSRTVFLGRRPVWGEMWRGLALVPVIFVLVTAVVLGLRAVFPGLHTVQVSPFAQYMKTPLDASILLVVVVLGGGVREELIRAFILHRFEQSLGGLRLGIVVSTVAFGLLHWPQGPDAAIAIGLLGLLWGLLYLRRRSAVMAMANHAGFDALQVLQGVLAHALGG